MDNRSGKPEFEAQNGLDRAEILQGAVEQGAPNDTPLEAMLDRLEQPIVGASPEVHPTFDARVLTLGGSVAQIKLDDQVYTLRITRQKKLILTK